MSETINISEVADKISTQIFKAFHWEIHPQKNENFDCHNPEHKGKGGKSKTSHPGDVIFHYIDPYLNKRIHLHTDLKSYGESSITTTSVRKALQSLAMTIECARESSSWRGTFLANETDPEEIRGMLFVANHDNQYQDLFSELISKINPTTLPLAKDQYIHVLGPQQITGLYIVANDIARLIASDGLGRNYKFFYPDIMLWKRQVSDDSRTPATVEMLTSPYFILKHDEVRDQETAKVITDKGSIVYYSRGGDTVEEFMYLIDSLLHYQLVNSEEKVRVRVFNQNRSKAMKSNFMKAKDRYCKDWGFHQQRINEINSISIDSVDAVIPNYCPAEIGWRESQ